MTIRPLAAEEQKYSFSLPSQIDAQTGCIGYIRGDFCKLEYNLRTSWFKGIEYLKPDEFTAEYDKIIGELREHKGLLHSLQDMKSFVKKKRDSRFKSKEGKSEYGLRIDTETYTYILRCNPDTDDYNFYCYCYVKKWLDSHIEKAKSGIRFIDSRYNELFRIPDGEDIIITYDDGEQVIRTCYYVDDYHFETGIRAYHICEFAEIMEHNRSKYEPVNPSSRL